MLVFAKVTLFEILPLKYKVKRFSVSWFGLCVYPVLCGVRIHVLEKTVGSERGKRKYPARRCHVCAAHKKKK
jgi:hypothetical protein